MRCFYNFLARTLMKLFRKGHPWKLPPDPKQNGIWFHAASLGELESLAEVITLAAKTEPVVIVTVFSPSGMPGFERLKSEIFHGLGQEIQGGFSPNEGDWQKAFAHAKPRLFVTAKYEAWPDIWASASRLNIPVAIVGTRMRKSFAVAKKALSFFRIQLPKLFMTVESEGDAALLKTEFPQAKIVKVANPRWDRVAKRLGAPPVGSSSSEKAKAWQAQFAGKPRPWGVLGSAWPADLKVLAPQLNLPGTIFIFPHEVTDVMKSEMIDAFVDGEFGAALEKVVIVMESGFLTEFYGFADWAYVGGGFGAGVHSTLEPAVAGLPVIAGPAGVERFPEAQWLQEAGILKVVASSKEFSRWAAEIPNMTQPNSRASRLSLVRGQTGGSQRVWDFLNAAMLD